MEDNLFREWPSYLGLSIIKSRKNSINNKGRKKNGPASILFGKHT